MAAGAGRFGAETEASPAREPLHFLSLPQEIQRGIVSHCPFSDLPSVALVCKPLHDLASTRLYRNFDIVFRDEDVVNFGSPTDGLAGGLDTFTTSNRNYAQYLRVISMDNLVAGPCEDRVYDPFHYSTSCGKFFNTLLNLTLRKAKSLETFRWNIRVELSRPVYRELHRIHSLKVLQLRLPPSDSPLPPPSLFDFSYPVRASTSTSSVPLVTGTAGKQGSLVTESPTISGFRNLKSLSILDIDSGDVVPELKTCIRNSFTTLKELQLSFSDSFALRPRNPELFYYEPADTDDDLHGSSVPRTAWNDNSEQARKFRAQEARKEQEAMLGKIFEVEPRLVGRPLTPAESQDTLQHGDSVDVKVAKDGSVQQNPDDRFVSFIREVGHKGSTTAEPTAHNSVHASGSNTALSNALGESQAGSARGRLHSFQARLEPLSSQLAQLRHACSDMDAKLDTLRQGPASRGPQERGTLNTERATILRGLDDALEEMCVLREQARALPCDVQAEADQHGATGHVKREALRRSMETYARETRGLSLESLRIHLMPVTSSVLARSVKMCNLRHLTLLKVGDQCPIWTFMAEEGKARPLALRSVFTDHVSMAFLSCMAQLPALEDMFLLQRQAEHGLESFAPHSPTTMEQIRETVLKKHLKTLRRLMIRDDDRGGIWDVDERTMILLCKQGVLLEELAISMGMHTMHAFMQFFPGLVSLRAICLVRLRKNRTSHELLRGLIQFMGNSLSHHPKLKVEWIAMQGKRAFRVVRPCENSDEAGKGKGKGKVKASGQMANDMASDNDHPMLPINGLSSDGDREDDDDLDRESHLRFRMSGPIRFCDVLGVKIFEKEICSGRL